MIQPCAAATRIGAALAAALLLAMPASAQLRTQRQPLVTIPPAPDAGRPVTATAAMPAAIEPAPRTLLPSRVQILRDTQGTGIVMYGALAGKAGSALAVLAGIFAYSQAFDPTPTLQLVLADRDDQRVQALFTGTAQGSPVIGIAVVALSDNGGDVSVFYDHAASFPAAFARMQQTLARSAGTGTVPLAPLRLADGSDIGIPQGWRVIGQGAGLVDLIGPLGQVVALGTAMPVYGPGDGSPPQLLCCDPLPALPAIYPQIAAIGQRLGLPTQQLTGIAGSQPAPAPSGGEAAFVLADLSVGGRPYSYFAEVSAVAGFSEPWTLYLSGVMAPQADFAREFPTLLRIWGSHSANPAGFADTLQQAALGIDGTAQILTSTITKRETADYNANEGWAKIIGEVTRAESRARIDDALTQPLVDRLTKDTGRTWRVVPPTELR
ncbi:MAG TPA: hypothetical protein VET89_04240 [Stellaceae bacterium]|nr:hypothetical protein [Stellaceae bacterium]